MFLVTKKITLSLLLLYFQGKKLEDVYFLSLLNEKQLSKRKEFTSRGKILFWKGNCFQGIKEKVTGGVLHRNQRESH